VAAEPQWKCKTDPESRRPVSQFHDSLGYYPGLRFRPANKGLYFWDAPASLVVPAEGNYTTRITWGDKTPATDLYGLNPLWRHRPRLGRPPR